MYTLIVIDMQPRFSAANEPTIRAGVRKEIINAIANRADIIFAEFVGYGATHSDLYDLVSGKYNRHTTIYKSTDSGAREIQKEINTLGFMVKRFRVVGINTEYCVYSTIAGLKNRFPNTIIELVESGCGSDRSHTEGLAKIRKLETVAIV